MRLGVTYSQLDLSASRTVIFPNFSDASRGQTDGSALQGFGEVALHLGLGPNAFLEPFVNASIALVGFDAFSETGGGSALRVDEQDYTLGTATAGLRGETRVRMGERGGFRLGGSVGLRNSFGDRRGMPLIALQAAPNQSFEIRSSRIDRLSAVGTLDATIDIGERASLTLGYSGVVGDTARDHAVRATFSLRF